MIDMIKIELDTDDPAYTHGGEIDEQAVAEVVAHVSTMIADGFTSGYLISPDGGPVGTWLFDQH